MTARTTKHVKPTDGFPRTRIIKSKDGAPDEHLIQAMYLTPIGARVADKLSLLLGGASIIGTAKAAAFFEPSGWVTGAAMATAPFVTAMASRNGLYHLFRKPKSVMFTPDGFEVRGLFGAKAYKRDISHNFSIRQHHKTEREDAICNFFEYRLPWWLILKPFKRYLGEAYYVTFEYMGQRNNLMLVYKHKTAEKILNRLNACDKIMDGAAGNGRGEVLRPEDEWPTQTGSLASANV